jgi:fatty-acyl-CoA synthase
MIYRCPIVFEDQFGDLMDLSHPTFKPLRPGQQVSTTGEILDYAARTYRNKVGLIDGSRSWTFGELDEVSNQFAHALITKFADLDGPIGIIGKNSVEYAVAHFGIARTGRYSINFPTRCTAEELVYAVNLTKPAVLLVDADCQEIVDSARAQFETVPLYISMGNKNRATESDFWDFLADQLNTAPEITIDPDARGSVVFNGRARGLPTRK